MIDGFGENRVLTMDNLKKAWDEFNHTRVFNPEVEAGKFLHTARINVGAGNTIEVEASTTGDLDYPDHLQRMTITDSHTIIHY